MKETWIIPCNNKVFNITNHLLSCDEIAFKKMRNIQLDDDIYLYIGGGEGQIKYKGYVINNNCSSEIMEKHSYAKKKDFYGREYPYILVKITEEYDNGTYPYVELKANDIGQVQTQARASKKLLEFLNSKQN